jgi:hypothetical protein
MDELSIPQSLDDSAGDGSRRSGRENHRAEQPRRGRWRIASEMDCLAVLSQLGRQVALGLLSTAQANTIRGAYSTILQHYQRQQSGPARTVVNEQELAKQLRKNPGLANVLEPLLTREQIEMFLRGDMDADDMDADDEDADDEDADDEDADDEDADDEDADDEDADDVEDAEDVEDADEFP